MTKKPILILCSFLAYFSVVAQDTASISIPNRELIILLDYGATENISQTLASPTVYSAESMLPGISALTVTTLIALHQQAAPILINGSLLKNIFDHANIFKDFSQQNMAYLLAKYKNYTRFSSNNSIKLFKEHCSYAARIYPQLNQAIKNSKKTGLDLLKELAQDKRFGQHEAPKMLYHKADNITNEAIHRETMLYLMCWLYKPHQDNWHIKQVSPDLYLLVPKTYLENLAIDQSGYKNQVAITPSEAQLGLKIQHLTDITNLPASLTKLHQDTSGDNFTQDLAKLFVLNSEISVKNNNRWALYVAGHGFPRRNIYKIIKQLEQLEKFYTNQIRSEKNSNQSIFYKQDLQAIKSHLSILHGQVEKQAPYQHGLLLSLNLSQWNKALQFFNNNLHVSLLFYSSCYAGGEHLIKPYLDNKNRPLLLHYPVISGTLSENRAQQDVPLLFLPPYTYIPNGSQAGLFGICQEAIDTITKQIIPVVTLNFNAFFNNLRTGKYKQEKDFNNTLLCLHPYSYQYLGNIPLWRPAGSANFTILPGVPNCIQLTADIANKKKSAQPIQLNAGNTVLVYADHITNTVTLNKTLTNAIPQFVSMAPQLTAHIFEEIQALDYRFTQVANAFLPLPDLTASNIFWIKKLTCLPSKAFISSGLIPAQQHNKNITLDNIIVMRNICTSDTLRATLRYEDEYPATRIYFTYNNKSYCATWTGSNFDEKTLNLQLKQAIEYKPGLLALCDNLKHVISDILPIQA